MANRHTLVIFVGACISLTVSTWGTKGPFHPPAARRVCWLGLEPQGTPNQTFLLPNGSPSNRFGHFWRQNAQNSGPDLAVGVPGPESQLFVHPFWTQKCKNSNFCQVFEIIGTHRARFGAPGAQRGPRGRSWTSRCVQHAARVLRCLTQCS